MSSSGEIYGMPIMPDRFNLDVLLPNGICITLPCKREDNLEQLKWQIWKNMNTSAARYSDIGQDQTAYIFSAVTLNAEVEEFYEESRRLCDLRLFDYVVKLIEPEGNKEEKKLSGMIDLAIDKKVNQLFLELPRELKEEVHDFRTGKINHDDILLEQLDQGLLYSSYSSTVDIPFRLRIISATYVNVRNVDAVSVEAAIYQGFECLGTQTTAPVDPSNPKWDEWLTYEFHFSDLPRSAKICLSIYIITKKRDKEMCCLGSGSMTLFDYRGLLRSSRVQLELTPTDNEEITYPLGSLHGQPSSDSTCLSLEFWSFDKPVLFAPSRDISNYANLVINKKEPPKTSLTELLDSIDWKNRDQVSQLYAHLDDWEDVSLETALQLLDPKYDDIYVRKIAVKWLDKCLDEEMLSCYLLQFIQVLRTEPYIENDLSRFLIKRALENEAIGNLYFWYLRAECDENNDYHNMIRFRYLLERYLTGLPLERLTVLTKHVQGIEKLLNLTRALKYKSKDDRLKFMQEQMQRVDFSEMLQNIPDPTNHQRYLGELLHDQCRVMDSAKRPLWLVWTLPILDKEQAEKYPLNPKSEADVINLLPRNSRSYSYSHEAAKETFGKNSIKLLRRSIKEDHTRSSLDMDEPSRFSSRTMTSLSDSAKNSVQVSPTSSSSTKTNSTLSPSLTQSGWPTATSAIIVKTGDDLRQDMLTLQIIKIVDAIWRREGLNMCMLAYTCLATGKNAGIIEVVNRAETITSIQKSGGRMAAIQIDSSQLHRWIKERNEDNYDEAIQKFTRSCAGFSVLTFVLGIADRNPDNIMVSEDGRIFHIDFGHFLGHFKKKFGINRERVPFVLTDDFLQVISRGSDVRKNNGFDTFRELCTNAYFTLRKHSNLLITLFTMMLKTGIPELRTLDDISYLKTSLQVGQTEEKAREFFQVQFLEAYCGAWATKVDWFFHNIKRM